MHTAVIVLLFVATMGLFGLLFFDLFIKNGDFWIKARKKKK